jgi:hypothetical protein
MTVQLYSADPHAKLEGELFGELLKGAKSVEMAVAFVTESGADAIKRIVEVLNGGKVILIVSVLFPTKLEAIEGLFVDLKQKIEIWIHLGYEETTENLHGQFHSKMILIERADGSPVILVGSHNWTKNGLQGGNLEASLVLTGDESAAVLKQVREHFEACKEYPCEAFDKNRMEEYKKLQLKYHDNPPRPTQAFGRKPCPGFSPFHALALRAEDHTEGALTDSGYVWVRIPADWDNEIKPSTATLISLWLFKKHSLFGPRPSVARACCLQGTPEAIARNPERLQQTAPSGEFLIDNLERPCVVRLTQKPLPLQSNQEWAVIAFSKVSEGELLPLFHTGDEPPGWKIKAEYSQTEMILDESASAKPDFRVPFRSHYPSTAETSIEDYFLGTYAMEGVLPGRVKFRKVTHKMSPYVSFVEFRSDPALTAAIHGESERMRRT